MPGKASEALAVAKEVATIYKRVNGRDLTVVNAIGGNPHEFGYLSQVDSYAHVQEGLAKALADTEFRACQKKFEPLVVPGSYRDTIWGHV